VSSTDKDSGNAVHWLANYLATSTQNDKLCGTVIRRADGQYG